MSLAFQLRRLTTALLAVAALTVFCTPNAFAQMDESKHSHVLFDVRFDKLKTWCDANGMDYQTMATQITDGGVPADVLSSLTRIYGSLQLPADMETAQGMLMPLMMGGRAAPPEEMKKEAWDPKMEEEWKKDAKESPDEKGGDWEMKEASEEKSGGGGFHNISSRTIRRAFADPLPINFFIRFEFDDEQAAKTFADEAMVGAGSKVVDGKTFMTPPEFADAPENILFHMASPKIFEAGTTDYLTQDSRRVFSENLAHHWGKMGDEIARVVIDVKGVRDMVDQAVNMGAVMMPPEFGDQLKLVKKLDAIRLSIDMNSENLSKLVLVGNDPESAQEMSALMTGHIGQLKAMSGEMIEELAHQSPAASQLAEKIVNGMEVVADGNEVHVLAPKPADFDDSIGPIVADMKAAAEKVMEANNLRMIVLSVHNYHDSMRGLPFETRDGMNADLSWRGRISPYMEGPEIDPSMGPGEGVNAEAATQMPAEFGDDGANTGVSFVVPEAIPQKLERIMDGTSSTIMMIKTPASRPWLENGDITVDEAVALITGLPDGETILVGFYDGSVRRLGSGLSEDQIRPFLTPNGGESVDYDVLDR